MSVKNFSIGVTGASGFIGSSLIQQLLIDGRFTITAFARFFPASLFGVNQVKIGDMSENSDWNSMLAGLDCVVHTAARVHIMNEKASDSLDEFRKVNVSATLDIARAAVAVGVKRFIFISSIKVNGEESKPGCPFTPDDDPAPVDPYGVSKAEAEIALKKLASETGMELVIIRPVLVYGAGVKANFLNLLKLVQKRLPLPLGAIHNKRSLVAIENLVDLIITCIDHPKAVNQVFLVSDDHDLSTTELLRHMAKASTTKVVLLPIPPLILKLVFTILGKRSVGQRLCGSLQVDISKTKSLLCWGPPVSIDRALERTFRYIRAAS